MYPQQDTAPSCMQLMAQPAVFSSTAVPPFQSMPDLPQEIQKYIPSLAVLTGNEIARQAQINPAFVYLTNVVISGGYSGQLWQQLVSFATGLFWYNTQTKQGASVESLLSEAAATTIIFKASHLACQNNIVFGKLDPQTQAQVRDFAQQHDRLRAAFDQMVTQYRQQVVMAQNPGMAAQAYGGVVGNSMQHANVPYNQNPYGAATSGIVDPTVRTIDPVGIGGMAMLKSLKVPQKRPTIDPYATYDPQPRQTPAPVVVSQAAPAATVTHISAAGVYTMPVVQTPATKPWKPVPGQLYKPAYDNGYFKLTYEAHTGANGQPVTVATVQTKDDKEMQESEHQIPTLNKSMRQALAARHNQPPVDLVVSDLDLLVQGIREERTHESPESTEKLRKLGLSAAAEIDDLGAGNCLSELVCRVRRMRLEVGSKESVYFAVGSLLEHIVSQAPVGELIAKLGKATTLPAVINLLNQQVDASANDPDMLAAVAHLGRYITAEVNHVVQVRIGLTAVSIDDVLQDYEALVQGLRADFGAFFADAFVAYQPTLVKSLFAPERVGVESIHHVTGGVEGEDESTELVGEACSLEKEIGVTVLSIDSTEFGIEIEGKEAYEIFPYNFPGLQPFIACLTDRMPDLDRIYIVTLDDKVYGVCRSILGDKPTIIYNA